MSSDSWRSSVILSTTYFCSCRKRLLLTAALLIDILSMAYLLDHDCIIFDIEQNPIIAHAQPIAKISLPQSFDVAMKAQFQAGDLADDLRSDSFWQGTKAVH